MRAAAALAAAAVANPRPPSPLSPGTTGTPARLHQRARRGLAAHGADRRRRRPDERRARRRDRLGEIGVLRQEAVARVNRVRARLLDRVDNLVGAQVALARRRRPDRDRLVGEPHVHRGGVRVRVHRDGAQIELAAGADHPAGDLAAVGDQDLGYSASGHVASIRQVGSGCAVPRPLRSRCRCARAG